MPGFEVGPDDEWESVLLEKSTILANNEVEKDATKLLDR